jgi:DNA-binding NtrC family response regulator
LFTNYAGNLCERFSFSGADSLKIGFFELADGGTLVLDEIAELDLRVQGKLLRVDHALYFRLGGTKKVPMNPRSLTFPAPPRLPQD